MKIYVDSADIVAINRFKSYGICSGVTTNPTILAKSKNYDGVSTLESFVDMLDGTLVSLEVMHEGPEMLNDAEMLAKLGNVAIKIPFLDSNGNPNLSYINQLASSGYIINATAIFTHNQAILAALAGATFVSIFAGRIDDEGGDGALTISKVKNTFITGGLNSAIIAASVRTVKNVEDWILAGADIITITPEILDKMCYNARAKETTQQFTNDAISILRG